MTEKEPHISNELLAKYFAGELAAAESAVVENWAALSEENKEQLDKLHILWLDTGAVMLDEGNGRQDRWSKIPLDRAPFQSIAHGAIGP